MRLYGSSPLYSYVELIFRCKRLFIIAIVLGALISGSMVYMRKQSYTVVAWIDVSGPPPETRPNARSSETRDNQTSYIRAKYLDAWLENGIDTPTEFLPRVLAEAKLAPGYQLPIDQRPRVPGDLLNKARKALVPKLTSDERLLVTLTWLDPREAEQFMQAFVTVYKDYTITRENANTVAKKQAVEEQYKAAEKTANTLAKERVAFQRDNLNSISSMLAAKVNEYEQSRNQMSDASLDLSDARTRLADVNRQLLDIKPTIIESTEHGTEVGDPTQSMRAELDEYNKQLAQASLRYSSQHPVVKELEKKIDAVKGQIAQAESDLKNKPARPTSTKELTRTINNPEYRELAQQKRELERTVNALDRRVNSLQRNVNQSQASLRVMPDREIVWQGKERDYRLADTIRNNRKQMLETLRIELEQQTKTAEKRMGTNVSAADKTESSSKTIALYLLGPLLGVVMAFCFSLLLETMDHTLRTPVEAEKYLNKPVLAVIPKMAAARDSRKQLGGSSKTGITS